MLLWTFSPDMGNFVKDYVFEAVLYDKARQTSTLIHFTARPSHKCSCLSYYFEISFG